MMNALERVVPQRVRAGAAGAADETAAFARLAAGSCGKRRRRLSPREASSARRNTTGGIYVLVPGAAAPSLRSWASMPPLTGKERAQLPDSAFAYIDSRGKRRLPIHDAAHVRNALARFGQVAFEDDEARDRARSRLLRAAKKHGIMPIGFINAQLRPKLPTGHITFLLADVEGSTQLLADLGDQYGPMLSQVHRLVRKEIRSSGGCEVSARGDDLFMVFEKAPAALEAAVAIQRGMQAGAWPAGTEVRLRIALHRGRPALNDTGYVGLSVHAAARMCFAAHGDQILVSSAVRTAVLDSLADGISLTSLGAWRFRSLSEPIDLFQVAAADLPAQFPPLRSAVRAE